MAARRRRAGETPAVHAETPAVRMVRIRSRGRLPHWERDSATYFITFRLADSLPQSVLKSYEMERAAILRRAQANKRELTRSEQKQLAKLFSEKVEAYLDAGVGTCRLAHPQ